MGSPLYSGIIGSGLGRVGQLQNLQPPWQFVHFLDTKGKHQVKTCFINFFLHATLKTDFIDLYAVFIGPDILQKRPICQSGKYHQYHQDLNSPRYFKFGCWQPDFFHKFRG